MALTWSMKKCADLDTLTSEEVLNDYIACSQWTITERIILSTISVGIQDITEDTAKDFYVRLHLIERTFGKFGKEYICFEDVQRRIGLETNCTKRSTAEFKKMIIDAQFEQVFDSIREPVAT